MSGINVIYYEPDEYDKMNGELHYSSECDADSVMIWIKGKMYKVIYRICECGEFDDKSYVEKWHYVNLKSFPQDGIEIFKKNHPDPYIQETYEGRIIRIKDVRFKPKTYYKW